MRKRDNNKTGTVYVLIDCKYGQIVGAYRRKSAADEAAESKMEWKRRHLPWDQRHVVGVQRLKVRA